MITHNNTASRTKALEWVTAIIALSVVVIGLWLPYHLNFAGYGDEWVNLASIDAGSSLVTGSLRSFLNVPYIIAHILTPDSFAGMNIVLAITTFGRGIAIYGLMRQLLPENPVLALVAGGLTTVYPGDVGFYALVCSSITTALVFFLLALITFIDYWKHSRWYILLIMWLTLGFSIGIYEVSYPLILIAPLILVYLNRGFNWRILRVSLFWYAIPALYVLINVVIQQTTHNVTTYQLAIVNSDNSLPSILKGFGQVYIREFGQIFDWAVLSMPQGFSDKRTWLVIGITLIWGVVLWFHMRSVTNTIPRTRYAIFLLAGAIVLGIGFSLFSITYYRDGFYRTLFFGLPGAAIALAVFAWLLSYLQYLPRAVMATLFLVISIIYFLRTDRLSALLLLVIAIGFLATARWRYILVGASLVGYAGAAMMGYHILQPFTDLPSQQKQLATSIATIAPSIKNKSLILLTSPSNTETPFAIIRDRYDIFQSMMQFIYNNYDIEAQLCIPSGVVWGEFRTSCKFDQNGVVVTSFNGNMSSRWSYDRVIIVTYELDKGATLLKEIPSKWLSEPIISTYAPDALINHDSALPHRLETVWSDTP